MGGGHEEQGGQRATSADWAYVQLSASFQREKRREQVIHDQICAASHPSMLSTFCVDVHAGVSVLA